MNNFEKVSKIIINLLKYLPIVLLIYATPPILTNFFFSINAPSKLLIANWTSGEQLIYLVSTTSSLIAIIGVYITVKKGQDNLMDQHRENVLPFFAIETLEKKYKDILKEIFNSTESNTNEGSSNNRYEEFKLKEVFIIINENNVEYSREIDSKLKKIIEFGNKSIVNIGSTKHIIQEDTLSIPFQLVNYGNGNSVNMRIGLNKSSETNVNRKYIHPISILKNEIVYVHIISKVPHLIDNRNYDFEVIYHDIYGNEYQQVFKLGISLEKNNEYSFDPHGMQKRMSKVKKG